MTIGQSSGTSTVKLPYSLIRSVTSPAEKANGVQTWFANVHARDILSIGTKDNLRSYIAEHKPGKRNAVHKQIALTIEELPDRFINRNSGITITCTSAQIDDNAKIAVLDDASIINGAQTQGELRRYYQENGDEAVDFLVRAEIIMDPDHAQIVEVAIARNTATSVKSVSQAGARGHLADLKEIIERAFPEDTLQTSETDEEGINTQALLQWCRLLLPADLRTMTGGAANFAYKQGGKCLTEFSEWAEKRKIDPNLSTLYDFTVSIAPTAVRLYRHYEEHEAWNGHRLHEKGKKGGAPEGGKPVRRNGSKVIWVAPGILFPIMYALSAFVKKRNGGWVVETPSVFSEDELIRRAVQQYRAMDRQVAYMGRSEAAYDALSIYTETIASVTESVR
jgi:hypothetical protein